MYIPESINQDWVKPIILSGQHVTLRPLALSDCADLIEAVNDGELWKVWYLLIPSPTEMAAAIKTYLLWQEQGRLIPFAVVNNKNEKVIGMTGYFKMFASIKRLDIGWTWYRQSAHKTSVNTEAKLLLLQHAFEQLNAVVVGLGANWFNYNSRQAIERIGAQLDGILRRHVRMPNGRICDYCFYSIIDTEWPAISHKLKEKLHYYSKNPIALCIRHETAT